MSTGVRSAHTRMTMNHASEIGPKKPLSPSSAAPWPRTPFAGGGGAGRKADSPGPAGGRGSSGGGGGDGVNEQSSRV